MTFPNLILIIFFIKGVQINFVVLIFLITFAEVKETIKILKIMGYTHYFRITDERAKEAMPKTAEIIKDIFKTFPEVSDCLKGGNGYESPIIDEDGIVFNGDAEKGEDYETFRIDVNDLDSHFCKTARRPYDLAVCLCLIALKDTLKAKCGFSFRGLFSFESDGYFMDYKKDNGEIVPAEKNWAKARQLYNKYCRTHNMNIPNYHKWAIDE